MPNVERELRKLEQKLFLLEMQDHWNANDFKYANELRSQIKELKEKMNNE